MRLQIFRRQIRRTVRYDFKHTFIPFFGTLQFFASVWPGLYHSPTALRLTIPDYAWLCLYPPVCLCLIISLFRILPPVSPSGSSFSDDPPLRPHSFSTVVCLKCIINCRFCQIHLSGGKPAENIISSPKHREAVFGSACFSDFSSQKESEDIDSFDGTPSCYIPQPAQIKGARLYTPTAKTIAPAAV